MRVEQLDLNLLLALEILLEEQNITRSAERLHLSQSATSSILARLRSYFEDDLLVQVGRQMQPTPYALELEAPVKQILGIVRASITSKRQNNPELSQRHFRIIASDYITQVVICPLLAKINQLAPAVTFEFLTPFSHGAELLAKGGADFFISPEARMIDTYPHEFLIEDELVCIGDPAFYPDQVALTEEVFFATGHVSVGFERISRFSFEDWFKENLGHERKIDIISNDFNTLCLSLIGTPRLAMIPAKFAEQQLSRLPLKQFDIPFTPPKLLEYAAWHPTLDGDPMHRWLRELIFSTLRSAQS